MKTRSKRTYINICQSKVFNTIQTMSKSQNPQSTFEINYFQTRSLEHIFCFLSKHLLWHRFALSADKRRKPLLGARGDYSLEKTIMNQEHPVSHLLLSSLVPFSVSALVQFFLFLYFYRIVHQQLIKYL